jgi:hypothetical protein
MYFFNSSYVRFRLFLFLQLFSLSLFGANLPNIPGPVPAVLLPVDNAFNDLLLHANTQATTNLLTAASELERCLFDPLIDTQFPFPNQRPLLDRLRAIKNSLTTADLLMNPLVSNLKSMVVKRIDLARIDQNISSGRGRIGTFAHPNFSQNVQNTLSSITGVIFHITKSLVGGAINENVNGVGSATLVHFIPNAVGTPVPLNGILTCAHVLTSEGGERIEAYFVPSSELNLACGLPDILTGNPAYTTADLIFFLRNSPNSFQITNYSLWQRHPGLNSLPNNPMNAANPTYINNEDMVIASIAPNPIPGAALRNYNSPATVNFIIGNVAATAHIAAINEYFAIGYPGCDQYDPANFLAFPQALINALGISPLFVTKASLQQGHLAINNGQISHKAPAAPGMSGGPLLTVAAAGDVISIFGIVTEGDDNDEIACNIE